MTVKRILFTDLTDPLQRELLQCLEPSAARVFCLGETRAEGVERVDQLQEPRVDEVWHSVRRGLRAEQQQQDLCELLKAIASAGIPVINYLATDGPGWEMMKAAALLDSSAPARLPVDADREIEAEFVTARNESGLGYRIFKPQNLIEARGNFPYPQANKLYDVLGEIVSLKEEVEDKSEGYFSRHPLRIEGAISLPLSSLAQAAEAIFKIAAEATTLNGSYRIAGAAGITLADFLDPLSESMGIKIEPQSESAKFNPVDLLLHDRLSVARSAADATEDLSEVDANLPSNDVMIRSFMNAYARGKAKEAGRIERAMQTLQRRTIERANDERLCYYVGGSGERSIVIVNAYGQGLAYWTKLLADLVETFRLIVWLPRSSGHDTVGVIKSHPVTDHREDLKELLTREQINKAEFVGWCTGPKLILDYYAAYPDDVASMIFLGATFKDWPGHSDTDYEKSLAPLLKMVQQRPQLAAPLIDALKKVLLARSGDGVSFDPDDPNSHNMLMKLLAAPCSDLKEAVLEPLLSEASVISYAEQLLDFWNHDATEMFAGVSVPVLFISGECDQIAHPQMAQAAAQMIPGARRLEVRGGSHYLLYERSALMSGLFDLFLRNCQSAQLMAEAAAQ